METMVKKVTAVVLGAGKSKRTRTNVPKVLLDLGGKPLIFYILETLSSIKMIDEIFLVVGHKREKIQQVVYRKFRNVRFVVQPRQNGTAKAVEATKDFLKEKRNLLVICGDTPLIRKDTLKKFINFFFKKDADCAIITALFKEKSDLGKVIRDSSNRIKAIIEKTNIKSRDNEEVNSGIYCFKKNFLFKELSKIKLNKKKREFFLTDIINIFYNKGFKIESFIVDDEEEILGVNTQKNFALVRKIINQRFLEKLMSRGVSIVDPETTFVSFDTKIGINSIVYPFTFIEKNVIIGNNCVVGPFAHIRAHSKIEDNSKVGNFTEINRSVLKKNVRMKHFSYIGDTTVGEAVNIGAGTVIANYDGKRKHNTTIGKRAFIGSGTVIVAPANIGEGAMTGAGSVVTKPVKSNTIVVGVPARVFKRKKSK